MVKNVPGDVPGIPTWQKRGRISLNARTDGACVGRDRGCGGAGRQVIKEVEEVEPLEVFTFKSSKYQL